MKMSSNIQALINKVLKLFRNHQCYQVWINEWLEENPKMKILK